MQNLITFQSLTMSSTEIAELVNKRHDNVKRTIETLAKSEIIQLPQSEKVENKQSNSPNRFTEVFIFEGEQGKRDSIIVVAQLCPEFTACLVDRWQELEQKLPPLHYPLTTLKRLKPWLSQKRKRLLLLTREMKLSVPNPILVAKGKPLHSNVIQPTSALLIVRYESVKKWPPDLAQVKNGLLNRQCGERREKCLAGKC